MADNEEIRENEAANLKESGESATEEGLEQSMSEERAPKRRESKPMSKGKKALIIVLAVVIFALAFGGGFLTHYLTINESQRTASWLIDMIDKYYLCYDEETGEIRKFTPEDYALAISSLLDRYSGYYSRKDYSDMIETSYGNRFGIGVSFLTGGDLTIYAVTANSPAARAGVRPGGLITAIGYGEKTPVSTYDEFSAAMTAIPANTDFQLYVNYEGTEKVYTLQRESFVETYVSYKDSEMGYAFLGNPAVGTEDANGGDEVLGENTAYIKYTSFMYGSAKQLGEAIDYMKSRGRENLVLDLRGNGGGYIDVLQDVAEYFIDTGKSRNLVALARYKDGKEEKFYTSKNRYKGIDNIVVLADSGTASASECLIGALSYYGAVDKDTIVITKKGNKAATYGKGIMQTTYPHIGEWDAVRLTTAYIYWPDGTTNIHGKGIVASEENAIASENGYDAQLKRALEIFAAKGA